MIVTKQKRYSQKSRLVLPLITVAVFVYFTYHLYFGMYGLYSGQKVEKQLEYLHQHLADLESKSAVLRHKIRLLTEGSIEKDMLDEYARRTLNLVQKNQRIVLLNQSDKK